MLSLTAHAQDSYFISSLTVDDGLSNQTINSIKIGPHGHVWIATRSGIDRYDGMSLRHYTTLNNGFRTNDDGYRTYLAISSDSTIWAFNENGKALHYNVFFDRYEEMFNARKDIPAFTTISSYIDKDHILLGSENSGIAAYSHTDNKLIRRSLETERVACIVPYKNGYLTATNNGIFLLDKQLKTQKHITSLPNETTTLFHDSATGYIWIGTRGHGLWMMKNISSVPMQMPGHERLIIYNIKKLNTNHIIIGSDGLGVFRVDASGTSPVTDCSNDRSETPFNLPNSSINDIEVDKGNVWFATRSGISLFRKNTLFKRIVAEDTKNTSDHFALDVNTDQQGRLWIACNQRIACHDFSEGITTTHLNGEGNFLTITSDKNGNIWCGGWDNGIIIYNPATGTHKRYLTVDDLAQSLPSNTASSAPKSCVFDIFCDSRGDLWLSGLNFSLTRIHPNADGTFASTQYPINQSYIVKQLTDHEVVAGTTWGFHIIDTKTGKTEHHLNGDDYPEWNGIQLVNDLDTYNGTEIWLGTDGCGILRYDTKTKKYTNYGMHEGLPSNSIRSMVMDKKSHTLYIGTENAGMFAFDCDEHKVVTGLKRNDGLLFNEFMHHASCLLPDGRLIMGGFDGTVVIKPSRLTAKKTNLKVLLNQMEWHNETISPGTHPDIVHANFITIDHFSLPYEHRSLRLHVCTNDVYHQADYTFSYKLSGMPDEWQSVSSSRIIDFNNLAPGSYQVTLRAQASNGETVERTITIDVAQILWRRWYMIVLYILLTAALLYWRITSRMHKERIHKAETIVAPLVQSKTHQESKDNEFLKHITQVIEQNMSNSEFSVPDLCSAMAMSRTVLFERSRQLLSITPNDLIRTIRMKHAMSLIEQGSTVISDIAYACGYSDPRYFSTVFKKHYGKTPTQVIQSYASTTHDDE